MKYHYIHCCMNFKINNFTTAINRILKKKTPGTGGMSLNH